MKFNKIIIIVASILLTVSCNQDEVFEKEQYKNVFALISEDDNLYRAFLDLDKPESVEYISFSMGGTNKTTEDVVIKLVEDPFYIEAYNKANFDMTVAKYISPLKKSKYDIDSYECTIPAGGINGQVPVRIRPEGLSPDSAYFISVRVDSYTSCEVNPEKSYLLYHVRTKNRWAVSNGNTNYTLRGKRKQEGSTSEIEMPGMKTMHPISKNKVRIMAGTETYKSEVATFNESAIVLEIGDDNKVTIAPYKNIEVSMIDGDADFPNIYRIDDDGFKTYKTFMLYYKYKVKGVTYEMKEELRLQFNAKDEEKNN